MTGNHRIAAGTKSGRRLVTTASPHRPWEISKEIQDWNREVEEKKAEKKRAKEQNRAHGYNASSEV